jgi:hypothetical protein
MEIAGKAEADPDEVSLPLMIAYMPQLAYDDRDPIAAFVAYGREARFIRPSTHTAIQAPASPANPIRPIPDGLAL